MDSLAICQFDLTDMGFQMREFMPWLPMLGLNYDLGLDGLSLMMVGLSSLLTWIVILSSAQDKTRPRFFYSSILFVNGVVAGAFLAQNLLLFFLLFEIELVPLYFLIAIWGGEKRDYAATKFLLYTATAGALIFASFIGLVWLEGTLDFSYATAIQHNLPMSAQVVLLSVLLVGFGIKIPLIPFHTWLPDTVCGGFSGGGDFARRRTGEAGNLRHFSVWFGVVSRCLGIAFSLFGNLGSG